MLLLACYLFAPQFVLLAHVINLGCCLSSHAQLLRARCACSKAKRPVPNFLAPPPPHAPLRHARPPSMPPRPTSAQLYQHSGAACAYQATLHALLPRRALPRKLMLNQKVIAFFHGNISTYQTTTTTILPYILCKRSLVYYYQDQITFTIVYVYSSVVYISCFSQGNMQPLTSSSKQFCLLQKTNDHTAFVPAACSPYWCRLLPSPPSPSPPPLLLLQFSDEVQN